MPNNRWIISFVGIAVFVFIIISFSMANGAHSDYNKALERVTAESLATATSTDDLTVFSDPSGLTELTGRTLKAPAGATEVSYTAIITDYFDIPQVSFIYDGLDCQYRELNLGAYKDLSGINTKWTYEGQADVGPYTWDIKTDGTNGIALCYNEDESIMRSLSIIGTNVDENTVITVLQAVIS